jgi:DNA-binding CsgD family transcriptional regulator
VVPLGGKLVEALSASWHRLSPRARKVTQLLAIAGTPVGFPVLEGLATRRGVIRDEAIRAVVEATEQGITLQTDSGAVWFRHPLLAEIVAATLKEWEVADIHQEVAELWLTAHGVDERDRANALSLHLLAAGDLDQGLTWSLRAADLAGTVRAWEEQANHLSTAAALIERLPDDVARRVEPVGLLMRAARAHEAAGDDRSAVRHYEDALARVDRSADPLLASRILLELHLLRDMAGQTSGHLSLSEPTEVLALTEGGPDSTERALAFAHLAFAEVFMGLETAGEHAETAVRLAEGLGDPRALVWSLGTRGQTRWGTDAGIADSERAFALARDTGDPQLHCQSAFFLSNSYESAGRYADAAEATVQTYQALRAVGQFDYAAAVGAIAARWCFTLGRWPVMRPMLRELLTMARSDNSAGLSRCVAALLTAHEGSVTAAGLHLERAEELMPHAAPVGDPLADTQMHVDIAVGQSQRALDRIEAHMAEALEVNPIAADEWLELASRAALQCVERSSDIDERRAALRTLERIEATRGTTPHPFDPAGPLDVVHPAFGALYAAQRAQLSESPAETDALWDEACRATERADMYYEHARALYRRAHHLLGHRRDRHMATTSLATARKIASALGARPLLAAINDLSLQTHLALAPQEPKSPRTAVPFGQSGISTLTSREREILDGLIAGETYAQIAHRLFISEKTVSSHVSHILRKTGKTSRIELARLLHRDSGTL